MKNTLATAALLTALAGCDMMPGQSIYPHMWDPPGQETPADETCMSDLFKGIPGGAFGNTASIVEPAQTPGVAPFGWGPIHTVNKFPGHLRKANVTQETDPAIITASVYSEPSLAGLGIIGPLSGIALWGSGSSATNVAEFDIPIGTSLDPDFVLSDPTPFDTPRGGTFISVVGTCLEIRARNDANLIPAGPSLNGANQSPIGAVNPAVTTALVSAALGKGPRATEFAATKTVWAINTSVAPGGLTPTSTIYVRVPPFAKSFRIARATSTNTAGAISFGAFGNTFSGDGTYNVAANVIAPEVKLSGGDTTVQITNTEGVLSIFRLYVIFFLSI